MKNFIKPTILIIFTFLIFNINVFPGNEKNTIFKIDSITDAIELNKFWKYHPGDDTLWAAFDYDDHNWDTTLQTTINLPEVSEEKFTGLGWFRLHLQIDTSLRNKTFALTIDQQGASEIYLNGELIASHGAVGINDTIEETYNPKEIPFLIEFNNSVNYVLAIRYSNLKAGKKLQTLPSRKCRIYNQFKKFYIGR